MDQMNPVIEFKNPVLGEIIINAVRNLIVKKNALIPEGAEHDSERVILVYEYTESWHLGQRAHNRENDLIVMGGRVGDEPIYPTHRYTKLMVIHKVFTGIKLEEDITPADVIGNLQDFHDRLVAELQLLGVEIIEQKNK